MDAASIRARNRFSEEMFVKHSFFEGILRDEFKHTHSKSIYFRRNSPFSYRLKNLKQCCKSFKTGKILEWIKTVKKTFVCNLLQTNPQGNTSKKGYYKVRKYKIKY